MLPVQLNWSTVEVVVNYAYELRLLTQFFHRVDCGDKILSGAEIKQTIHSSHFCDWLSSFPLPPTAA